MNEINQSKKRDIYIDALRIFACLMVIFNHTNERGFYRYVSDTIGGIRWWMDLIPSTMCKSAVPLFFMISGSMLLRKDENIKNTYKRIFKILIDLVLFSFLYFGFDAWSSLGAINVLEFLKNMITSNYWHLWYLYAHITLIITLPILREMVKGLQIKSSIGLWGGSILFLGIIPIIENFLWPLNGNLKPTWMISDIFIYPVLGYMIDNRLDIQKIKKIHFRLLWIFNIVCTAIGEICEYFYQLKLGQVSDEVFLRNFCIVNAVTIFITVKYIFTNMELSKKVSNTIIQVGICTYGIYLIHIVFLWKIPFFYKIWCKIETFYWIGIHFGIYLTCLCVFFICSIIVWVLRKVPVVKRLF